MVAILLTCCETGEESLISFLYIYRIQYISENSKGFIIVQN